MRGQDRKNGGVGHHGRVFGDEKIKRNTHGTHLQKHSKSCPAVMFAMLPEIITAATGFAPHTGPEEYKII